MFKVFRVNTKTKVVTQEVLKDDYKFFGNRGLVAKVMTDEVNPKCDPLGGENKLIMCTGLLAGTPATTAHRLSVGAKSPLTGGIKEANMGGNVATLLAQHGIKMIIIEDLPADGKWSLLYIDKDGAASVKPADEYAGMNNYELAEKLHDKYGDKAALLSIGVAAERGYKIATVQGTEAVTGHPSRAAARGGLGAVMASKKIKAIVIEKPVQRAKFPYADKERYDAANKKLIAAFTPLQKSSVVLNKMGTPGLVIDITIPTAMAPTKNFTAEQYAKADKINSKAWNQKMEQNGGRHGVPCQPGCLIRCSNIYNDANGKYLTAGLEYETYGVCGPNCDITDIDFIAEIDRICDDFGVDTIEIGCSIAVLMDCGKIPWGDVEATRGVLEQMTEGKTDLGKLIGEGTERLGKAIGAKRIPSVKGQSLAAYDPRNIKGMGVTYSTSPMGADHTAGLTLGPGDHKDKTGQVERSKTSQISVGLADNMMCTFSFNYAAGDPMVYPEMMMGAYGGEWDWDKMLQIGVKTLRMEHAWNKAAGFTAEDDQLPEFFYTEPSPATGSVYDITAEEMQEAANI